MTEGRGGIRLDQIRMRESSRDGKHETAEADTYPAQTSPQPGTQHEI